MPAVWLKVAKAFLRDKPLHELLSSVGTDGEVPLDQIGVDPRQGLSYEAHILIGRWRTLRLSSPHRGELTSAGCVSRFPLPTGFPYLSTVRLVRASYSPSRLPYLSRKICFEPVV